MQIIKRVRFEKDIIARVSRFLSGSGRFNVAVGQEVIPDEVIGKAVIASGFRTVNVAKLLEVSPSTIEKYLQKRIGQNVYKDELLALKEEGFLKAKKIVTSPTDGILDFINPQTGEIKMSLLPKKIDLPAGAFGIVESVDSTQNLIYIRTQITRIYGVFGTGRARDGILYILDRKNDLIDSNSVSDKYADRILVSRGLIYKNAISAAISSGVAGIITGGINAKDYRGMAGGSLAFPRKFNTDVGISMVVCEGFGLVPIGQDIFELLLENDQKFIFVDGNNATISLPSSCSDCMAKIRGTKLPETDIIGHQPVLDSDLVKIGMKARVAGAAFLGEQGKIIGVDKVKTRLTSGILAQLVTIETGKRKIQVPLNNIELI